MKKSGPATFFADLNLDATGLNLVQNNGQSAGQTVFHFHLHMIPRYDGDGVRVGWTPGKLTDEDKEEILSLFTD
jgi:histidine triad (HIT) family protein